MGQVHQLSQLSGGQPLLFAVFFDVAPYGVINIPVKYGRLGLLHLIRHHLRKLYPSGAQMYVSYKLINSPCFPDFRVVKYFQLTPGPVFLMDSLFDSTAGRWDNFFAARERAGKG